MNSVLHGARPSGSADSLSTDLLPAGTIVDGRYRIAERIGGGGMGTVYRALHVMVGRTIAIKVLSREMAAIGEIRMRFETEARAASAVGHPGIVEVFDAGLLADGRPFLVMEELHGHELTQEIGPGHQLPLPRACKIMRDVARAVHAAHEAGIVHRDIKPENIFIGEVDDREVIKVLDFGIAYAAEPGHARLTLPGAVMGTPEHMAPEQARGKPPVPNLDVYAMGSVLFEALTGQPPFLGESAIDTLLLKEERPAPRLTEFRRDAPEIIADLVAQCLEHDPAGRPASALELADRLDACLSGPEPATIELPTVRPRRRMGSPAWVLTSIAASCVMLAVFWAGAAPRATSIEHFGAVVMNPRSTIDASARVERPLLWTPVRPEAPPKAEVAPEITVPVGRVRGAHAALPSVEPEHANRPVPPPSAGTADCERSRQQAADARRAHDWTGVLRHSASARCWSSSADRLRLRVQAYMELGRFDRCLALGSGSTDADVQRFVTLCNHRRERAG